MTDTPQTPVEHSSVVGGSTAARRIGCPRSYALEQMCPPDKGSSYAREGTALHEMIAIVLDEDINPEELLPFTFTRGEEFDDGPWEFTVDADLWDDIGAPALAAFDAFIDEIKADQNDAPFDYEIEIRCEMPGIPEAFGTSDVIWRCGELSGIWDWKFGRKPVSAEENKQLMFYARAAINSLPRLFGPADNPPASWGDVDPDRVIVMSIMQPKVNEDEDDQWECTVAELETYRVELMGAVQTAVEQGEKAPINKGNWCDFARCKTICPLYVGQSMSFGEKMAKLKDAIGADAPHPDTVVDVAQDEVGNDVDVRLIDAIPHLLDLAEVAEEWAKAVFGMAHDMAEDGATIDGWKLKAKASSGRVFSVPDEDVQKKMRGWRYKLDDFMPRKMLTMPQMEKLVKKDGRAFPEEMYEKKPSSGTSLVRSDDPAPAVGSQSERVAELGNRLRATLPVEPRGDTYDVASEASFEDIH